MLVSSLDTQLFPKLSVSDMQNVFPIHKSPPFDAYPICLLLTEFCVFINSGQNFAPFTDTNGRQTSLDFSFFLNFEHTVKPITTILKQKTAGVIIFHPLRLRLSADMSTSKILYTTQSNYSVCFPIA